MVRKDAVRELRRLECAEAAGALVAVLGDDEIDRKAARALTIIARAKPERSLGPVLNGLQNPNDMIRRWSAVVLGDMRLKEAPNPLIAALSDPSERVRRSAARALGDIADAKATDRLVQALSDEAPSVRAASADALGRISDASALNALVGCLTDVDRKVRLNALQALASLPDNVGKSAVEAVLKSDDPEMKQEAERLLRPPEDPRKTWFRAMREDPTPYGRAMSAIALGGLGDPRAVPALIELLGSDDREMRLHASETLGELQNVSALPALREALRSEKDAEVRGKMASAIEALAGVGDATPEGDR